MPRVRDPSGQARQAGKASGPALKRCLDATVLTADRIDYWIRRHVIEYPPGAAGGVAPELRSADALLSAPAFASARHPVRPSRLERPVRSKPALACDRRAWLAALGRALECEYDALAAPVPARLAALVRQLEAQH